MSADETRQSDEQVTRQVHDHGPVEGRGLDCPEAMIGGHLVGACLAGAARTNQAIDQIVGFGYRLGRESVAGILHSERATALQGLIADIEATEVMRSGCTWWNAGDGYTCLNDPESDGRCEHCDIRAVLNVYTGQRATPRPQEEEASDD